jgi:hypothetical protein
MLRIYSDAFTSPRRTPDLEGLEGADPAKRLVDFIKSSPTERVQLVRIPRKLLP